MPIGYTGGETWYKSPVQDWWHKQMEDRKTTKEKKEETTKAIIEHGTGLYDTWIGFAFQDPPKDLLGRIVWAIGLWGQMVLSISTFPAALGAFLLEESVQTYGMGAYMLSTAGAYDVLEDYLVGQDEFIDATQIGAKTLAGLSPVTGGAVLIYLEAAKESTMAFRMATEKRLLDELKKEEYRDRLVDEATKYGTLNIRSSPSSADIYIDGVNTELLTPETFKRLDVGEHVITLFKYNRKREVTDSYTFEIEIVPGRKKEVLIHIPENVTGEVESPGQLEESDTSKLPSFIKAQVKGDYALDGDTFQTTAGERIRILGIDTPELGRPFADLAKEYTASLVEDKNIQLRIQTHLPIDKYGRTLAICESYKGNVAILLLSAGLARASIFDDATYDPARYLEAERVAKERRIGIWEKMP